MNHEYQFSLNSLLIPLLRGLYIQQPTQLVDDNSAALRTFHATLVVSGYTADRSLSDAVGRLPTTELTALSQSLSDILAVLTGSHVPHKILFKDFPNSVSLTEYTKNRIINHLMNELGCVTSEDAMVLSCGHIIEPLLFDIKKFGACPICQRQVPELDGSDTATVDPKQVSSLKILTLVDDNDLSTELINIATSISSISEQRAKLFILLLDECDLDTVPLTTATFKEILPIIAVRLLENPERIIPALSGATDILRIGAYLSGQHSLTDTLRFKLTNKQRHKLMTLLESIDGAASDMVRHKNKWIILGEVLHPSKFAHRYPKTAKAFFELRNCKIETFGSVVEGALSIKSETATIIPNAVLSLLKSRPVEFARRLDHVLRVGLDHIRILSVFSEIIDQVPTLQLMTMAKYFQHRNDGGNRVFLPHGNANILKVMEDDRPPLLENTRQNVYNIIQQTMLDKAAKLSDMPMLSYTDIRDMVLPFNQRGDSVSNTMIPKWSKFPIDHDGVLRMFVYWNAPVDVDLSVMVMDDNYVPVSTCAYFDDEDEYMVHSGDIQECDIEDGRGGTTEKTGATEYVDFDLGMIRDTIDHGNARYAVMFVNLYASRNMEELGFTGFECFAGIMKRDVGDISNEKKFDPKNVEWKFDVTTTTNAMIPIIFDLVLGKMVYADLSMAAHQFTNISSNAKQIGGLMDVVMNAHKYKPTIGQLLDIHTTARDKTTERVTLTHDDFNSILQEYSI